MTSTPDPNINTGDMVWFDADHSNLTDAAELGIPGVVVSDEDEDAAAFDGSSADTSGLPSSPTDGQLRPTV